MLILHLWLYTLCTLFTSVQLYKCTVLLYSNSLTHREVKLAQCPWSDLWLGLMPSLLFTVHFTLYTVHCTLYTVHSTLYTVHCTLYSVHCTLYTVHFTLYTVHWTDAFLTPPSQKPNSQVDTGSLSAEASIKTEIVFFLVFEVITELI